MRSEKYVTPVSAIREASLGEDIAALVRLAFAGRRGVVALAVAAAVPALWFGWPWLVAAGIAPLLLALAPCAVMCVAGLCMGRTRKTSEAGAQATVDAETGTVLSRSAADEPKADEAQPSLAVGAEARLSEPQAPPIPSQPSTREIVS